MFVVKVIQLVVAALIVGTVVAHVELSSEETAWYNDRIARNAEALSRCLQKPELQDLHKRMAVEQKETLRRIRRARGLDTRDMKSNPDALRKWSAFNHEQNKQTTDPQELFGFHWDDEPSSLPSYCATAPENIPGPFYHEGQLERQDIRMSQEGVYLRLAMQVIDVSTCMPLEGARVDAWHSNALGVYSPTNTSFLRGWQVSSNWGTVEFDTIFPGSYGGRNVHSHVAVRPAGENRFIHVGQIFWDEYPRTVVVKTHPYTENKNEYVSNLKDGFTAISSSDRYDPFARWSWLGPNIPQDGMVSWVSLGVNLSDHSVEQPKPNNGKRGFRFLDEHLEY